MTTPPPAIGLPVATRRELLDQHARALLDVISARGHRHWMVWLFHSGRYLLHIRIADAVFSFASGVLRRMDPAAPDGRGLHINGRAFESIHHKAATKRTLAAHGFTCFPEGRRFAPDEVEAALAYAAALGGPICVKPDGGSMGVNVTVDLTDPGAIRAAFARAASGRGGEAIVVERSLSGEVFRFFYVAPRVVGVRISRPPSVVGNGLTTIADLVAQKNRERLRRNLPSQYPIVIDAVVEAYLARFGLNLGSVPPAGVRVTLQLLPNVAVGGDFVNCAPNAIDPSYVALVEEICGRLGLRLAGLDTIVTDRARPASRDTFTVLEINNSPGLTTYASPWEGAPQDVVGPLVDLLERLAAGETV